MSHALLRVAAAGPIVTVQDGGRPGLQRYGVPASGPLDRLAFAVANRALGNPDGAAGLEASLPGLTLECIEGAASLAVTGGGFFLRHGEVRGPAWRVLTLRAGERLAVEAGYWGAWAYVAFAGQLDAPLWLGSRSTHSPSGLGGGRIRAGDILRIDDAEVRPDREADLTLPVIARPRHSYAVVAGPQDRLFPAEALAALVAETFVLSDAYDRMGVRLLGPSLAPRDALSIPSEAVAKGSIQVSGDGVATVLLADHQTTGGYPKIATLLSSGLGPFAQLRPRARVRFELVSPAEAVARARQRARAEAGVLAAVGPQLA